MVLVSPYLSLNVTVSPTIGPNPNRSGQWCPDDLDVPL